MYPKDKRIIVSPKISPDFCLETFYYLPQQREKELERGGEIRVQGCSEGAGNWGTGFLRKEAKGK